LINENDISKIGDENLKKKFLPEKKDINFPIFDFELYQNWNNDIFSNKLKYLIEQEENILY
jgi:hypothetical protein